MIRIPLLAIFVAISISACSSPTKPVQRFEIEQAFTGTSYNTDDDIIIQDGRIRLPSAYDLYIKGTHNGMTQTISINEDWSEAENMPLPSFNAYDGSLRIRDPQRKLLTYAESIFDADTPIHIVVTIWVISYSWDLD